MLGIGCPDRHALPRITLSKMRRPRRVLPSRASGFVLRHIADLRHREARAATVRRQAGTLSRSPPSVLDPVDVDQDVPWSAEYLVVAVRRRINHEPRVLCPTNELADRDLSLQPRQRATETEVDAAAIAKVCVILAFEVHLVRVREPARVAVSRSVQHNNRCPLWNGRSRNLDVFEGGTGRPELDRRFESQELLDPRYD